MKATIKCGEAISRSRCVRTAGGLGVFCLLSDVQIVSGDTLARDITTPMKGERPIRREVLS
jgi:hypothetical protein